MLTYRTLSRFPTAKQFLRKQQHEDYVMQERTILTFRKKFYGTQQVRYAYWYALCNNEDKDKHVYRNFPECNK